MSASSADDVARDTTPRCIHIGPFIQNISGVNRYQFDEGIYLHAINMYYGICFTDISNDRS